MNDTTEPPVMGTKSPSQPRIHPICAVMQATAEVILQHPVPDDLTVTVTSADAGARGPGTLVAWAVALDGG